MQNDIVTLVKDNPERPSQALNYLMQSTGYNKPSSEGEPECTD